MVVIKYFSPKHVRTCSSSGSLINPYSVHSTFLGETLLFSIQQPIQCRESVNSVAICSLLKREWSWGESFMVGSADMVQARPSNEIGVPVRTLYGRFLACYFMTATLSIVVISRNAIWRFIFMCPTNLPFFDQKRLDSTFSSSTTTTTNRFTRVSTLLLSNFVSECPRRWWAVAVRTPESKFDCHVDFFVLLYRIWGVMLQKFNVGRDNKTIVGVGSRHHPLTLDPLQYPFSINSEWRVPSSITIFCHNLLVH